MSLLFRNWLEEGYYEEDSMGDLTKLDDIEKVIEAKKDGKLYYHDGYSIGKVDDNENLDFFNSKL